MSGRGVTHHPGHHGVRVVRVAAGRQVRCRADARPEREASRWSRDPRRGIPRRRAALHHAQFVGHLLGHAWLFHDPLRVPDRFQSVRRPVDDPDGGVNDDSRRRSEPLTLSSPSGERIGRPEGGRQEAGVFTPEHAMLRKSVRAFVEKEVAPRVDEWEEAGRIPKAFWRRLGELGFLGLEFPVEYGGAGGDFLSSVVLGEEMARCRSGGVAFSVLVHTDMSSPWLTRYGNDAQKRKYLPGIIRGDTVCALGITEPGTGSDMANLSTRALRNEDHYLLTGSKTFITNGVYGDLYFVAARTGEGSPDRRHDGLSMFLVERGWPG